MKFLFDFLPFVVFFITYALYDFYIATMVLIIASVSQLLIYWIKDRKLEKMLVLSVALIIIFGGSTLIFRNENILKWKTSIFSFMTAGVFLASHYIGKRVLLQRMFSHLNIPEAACRFWNMAWVIFLISIGILNCLVAYFFSTDVWVYFKVFGLLGLTILFLVVQSIAISKYVPKESIKHVKNHGNKNDS